MWKEGIRGIFLITGVIRGYILILSLKRNSIKHLGFFSFVKRAIPCTERRSNQSILKEISPGISLEGMMLKLKLQYFGHLM